MLHVKGALNFTNISKVNGVQYHCFRRAFKARGLLTDNAEWLQVLADAV